jgi:hypothetical protein
MFESHYYNTRDITHLHARRVGMLGLGLMFVFLGIPAVPATGSVQEGVVQASPSQTEELSSQGSTPGLVGNWRCKGEVTANGVRIWFDTQETYTKYHTSSSKGTIGIGEAAWEMVTRGRWRMKKGKLCDRAYSCESRALNAAAREFERSKGGPCSKEEACMFIALSGNTMEQHLTDPPVTAKCTRR